MVEIICSGFGGQGVLVAGTIIADAGMEQGKNVTWYPSYGSEMRGGTANCNVKISDEEIASPYCDQLDILFTLNDAAIDKFESQLRPGGLLLVNSNLAAEIGNTRGTNIVMLGAMSEASPYFDKDYMRGAIDHYFAKKGKVNAKNAVCFDRGAEIAAEQLKKG